REYDRNRRGRRLRRQRRRGGCRGQYGDLATNQIGGERRKSVIAAFRPAILDRHILALDIAGLLQTLMKRAHHGCEAVGQSAVEEPDHRHCRLLRPRRQRPRRRAAEKRNERAALHSITSSARASSVGGTSRPSALAVTRLTTRSNLVGCSTGMSAGFAPRRILSTYSAARRKRSGKFGP